MLVARPFMADYFFKRSVILLVEQQLEGTIGFVANKPTEINLGEVMDDLKGVSWPVYNGGPVFRDQLFFIHRHHQDIRESQSIGNGLYWGGNYNDMIGVVRDKLANQNSIKFFIGYSGWGKGQLQDELENNSWFIQYADDKLLMMNGSVNLWGKALKNMGSSYAALAHFPDDPSLN